MANILVISDLHIPYHHIDSFKFLESLKREYKPTRVICIGDEIDYHAISFHAHDPDLFSPGEELKLAIEKISQMIKLFPRIDFIESNHGSLVYRKGKFHGLPRDVFKSYRDIIGAPKNWNWHFDLTVDNIYFHHGKSSNGLKLSQAMGMSVVQGHYHESFGIQYWGNPLGLFWSMQVGCLIDNKSLAFEYNKTNLKRPVVGCGMIIDGLPMLCPMILNQNGRWIGK